MFELWGLSLEIFLGCVWQVFFDYLEGVVRVSGRFLEVVFRVCGAYLWDVQMVMWGV